MPIPKQTPEFAAVLQRARRRFQQAVEAEKEIREEFQKDMDFLSGDQWAPSVKADREKGPSPRPCLVFNKVLPPVTQLGNQARQNKPAILVSPVDSSADPDTAKVLQGMVRHIEYDSDADQAYDTALFYAAGGGFGYWRYGCEESDPLSFDQDIKCIAVEDPLSIYLDCFARKPDRSDAKWAFVLDRLSNDAHEARFGGNVADLSSDFSKELEEEGWLDDESKQVAEYWEVTSEEKTLRIRKDADGTVHPVYLEDLDPEEREPSIDPETGEPAWSWVLAPNSDQPRERTVELPKVTQYVINGAEVLEKPTDWDGDTIPIVQVTGLEMIVRGKRKLFSMTRFSRDPQQLLNFYKTMEAETISLAPKPKYVGAVGQFRTKRRDWQRANTDNAAFLEYDPVAVGDRLAPEPQWRTFDPPVQALAIGAAAAIDDIKSSTGYFDASLGQNKSDQSGVAIGKLQRQGDVSNFHFLDNLSRALKRGGRILVQLIPFKYDTAREVRVIGEDQKQRIVKVNQPFVDEGKHVHHKLNLGKYDVTVQQGPTYTAARAETRDAIIQLSQGNPKVMDLGGDIFWQNSDFIGADTLAARWKKTLPPALQDDDANQDVPPAIQAKLAQDQQAIQMLTARTQELNELLKTKVLDLESRERIATQSNLTRIQTAETLSKAASMQKLAELDHAAIEHLLDLRQQMLHANLTIEADAAAQSQAHQNAMQQQQAPPPQAQPAVPAPQQGA